LGHFRDRFHPAGGTIYLDGNSLGLAGRDAEAAILRALSDWKRLAINGWLAAEPSWFHLGEALGDKMAPLVGAAPGEVVVTGSTTVNLHALVATFFPSEPDADRRIILADELNFPSDLYALQGFLRGRGLDPSRYLRLVESRDGRTIQEKDLIAAMTGEVALAVLPSVLYRSGQLLDMERLTEAAHRNGILIGFDCSHSVGVIPHHFDRWGVDFAFWCTYKYLNGGPGSTGALHVNRRHHRMVPVLAGWWGSDKERQFDMSPDFLPASSAGAWQIGTIPVFSTAPLVGALDVILEAGIEAVREKSLQQTSYLMALLDHAAEQGSACSVGTPRESHRRGGHVAVEHPEGDRICRVLRERGIIPDFRPPNIIRLAPSPLYTSYSEIWQAVAQLITVEKRGDHLRHSPKRGLIT